MNNMEIFNAQANIFEEIVATFKSMQGAHSALISELSETNRRLGDANARLCSAEWTIQNLNRRVGVLENKVAEISRRHP